jgi:hypothetical protein
VVSFKIRPLYLQGTSLRFPLHRASEPVSKRYSAASAPGRLSSRLVTILTELHQGLSVERETTKRSRQNSQEMARKEYKSKQLEITELVREINLGKYVLGRTRKRREIGIGPSS